MQFSACTSIINVTYSYMIWSNNTIKYQTHTHNQDQIKWWHQKVKLDIFAYMWNELKNDLGELWVTRTEIVEVA